jgi:hypothetical protein
MSERIDPKRLQGELIIDQIEGRREASPHSPRWRPADFSFQLSGVIDLRSGAEQVSNASLPASIAGQSHNPHESKEKNES